MRTILCLPVIDSVTIKKDFILNKRIYYRQNTNVKWGEEADQLKVIDGMEELAKSWI